MLKEKFGDNSKAMLSLWNHKYISAVFTYREDRYTIIKIFTRRPTPNP